jgi:tetratricopeptide (TPR) repeat protein
MAKKKNKPVAKEKSTVHSRNILVPVVTISLVSALFIYLALSVSHIQDDTFITLRYVKNILAGNGAVFNPGERVEGYTSFLWTFILVLCGICKIDIVDASQYLSVFFGVLSIPALYVLTRAILHKEIPENNKKDVFETACSFIPSLMLAATGAFYYWSVSGMETSLFVFFLICSMYFSFTSGDKSKNIIWLAVFTMLSCLTRPEGYLFAAFFIGKILIQRIQKKQNVLPWHLNRYEKIAIIVFAVPLLSHFAFRLFYYGYLLPNTFYAKTSFSTENLHTGWLYFTAFCKDYLGYAALLVIPAAGFFHQSTQKTVLFLYALVITYSVYVISIGGDVLSLNRFWLPVIPFIYLLCAVAVARLPRKFRSAAFVLLAVIAALTIFNYSSNKEIVESVAKREKGLVAQFQLNADIINRLSEKKNRTITVAVSTIGALSYYTDAIVIDMLGLTDAEIAHHPKLVTEISNDTEVTWKEKKYNAEYVIQRNPDYIFFSTGMRPSSFAERALFTEKEFNAKYLLQFIPINKGDFIYVYARKSARQAACSATQNSQRSINPAFVKNYVHLIEKLDLLHNKSEGSFEELQDEYSAGRDLYPASFSDAYRIMGDAAFLENKYDESEKYYKQSMSADSTNTLTYFGTCYLYIKLGRQQEIVSLLQKMDELSLVEYGLYPPFNPYRIFGVKKPG